MSKNVQCLLKNNVHYMCICLKLFSIDLRNQDKLFGMYEVLHSFFYQFYQNLTVSCIIL